MTRRPDRERWVRIKQLLYEALEAPAAERAALLDRECAGDSELRDEVLALLAADAAVAADPASRSFLESGVDTIAAGLVATDALSEGVSPAPDPFPFAWGPLEVREHLGSGSFGDVYRAFDPVLRREVALKLRRLSTIDPVRAGESQPMEAHLEEARRLARVRHPNVLAVHGVETHEGCAGIWTDLVRGETLDRVLERSGPLPRTALARLGIDLCRALEAVHAAGMVHGDVKAANAMRDVDGRTILMDFGSGNSASTSSDLEETGGGYRSSSSSEPPSSKRDGPQPGTNGQGIQGTPVAMAPELFAGGTASVASDLYALGVTLYRLATGRYPFRGPTLDDLLGALRRQEAVRLEEARPDLPVAFARVVHRTLSPAPEDRPSSAAEMEWLLSASLGAEEPEVERELSSQRAVPNVPKTGGRFVGRRKELEMLRSLLTSPGWITVTGPGGSGKTRLAQQVASEIARGLSGGVTWIDLAPIREDSGVESALARGFGLRDDSMQSVCDQLVQRLGGPAQLLVLDNAEQIRAGVARVAEPLVGACPRLHVLVTSRRALGSNAEHVFRLSPMSLPEDRGGKEGLEIVDADAVRLLVDRVQRADRDFVLTAELAPAVALLVRRLDGIPLALELAAARVPVLGIRGLVTRLESGTASLPASRESGRDARQRTIRASIQWSYDLLSPEQAALFARLAVFSGGWTLEAAEAICADAEAGQIGDRPILDVLEELAELSLVVFEEQAQPGGRYRFHEVVRAFAAEMLATRESAVHLREAHLSWFQRTSWERGNELNGPNALRAQAFFDAEYANLMTALDAAIESAGRPGQDPYRPLHICVSTRTFWAQRGLYREGVQRTTKAMAQVTAPAPAVVRTLASLSSLHSSLGDFPRAEERALEAVHTARTIGDTDGLILALVVLARARDERGDPAGSREALEESLALQGEGHLMRRVALCNIGVAAAQMGDLEAARASYEKALSMARADGDEPSAGHIEANLAHIAWDRGQVGEARALAEEAVRTLRRVSYRSSLWVGLRILVRVALARGDAAEARTALLEALALTQEADRDATLLHVLEEAADLALFEGNGPQAAEILGFIAAGRESLRTKLGAQQAAAWEARIDRVRSALGATAFARSWARGRASDRDRVIAMVAAGD